MIDFFQEEAEGRFTNYEKIVYGGAGTGLLLVILGIASYNTFSKQLGYALLIFGTIIGFLPYVTLSFLRNRALREMEAQFPSFLKDLAESKRGGMTLIQSFKSARESDYGQLNSEIEKIHNQLTWGLPFPEVMERFSTRMSKSPYIQESVSILLQSFRSGGNITKTLESVARDATELREIMQEKKSQVQQQVLIMYFIYFLFIGITVGIYTMLTQLLGIGSSEPGALQGLEFLGEQGGTTYNYCSGKVMAAEPLCELSKLFGFVPGNVTSFTSDYATKYNYGNMAYYKSLLFSMILIQGLASGAVAGQISEGSPSAGIKHASIMIPIAIIIFIFAIGTAGV